MEAKNEKGQLRREVITMKNSFSNAINMFMEKVDGGILTLYGVGKFGRYALENIRKYFPNVNIGCFIDDNLIRNNAPVENLEVVSLAEAVKRLGKNFYILITNYYVSDVLMKIDAFGLELEKVFFDGGIMIPDIDEGQIKNNVGNIQSVYELLCDFKSKFIYRAIVESYATKNIDALSRLCGTTQYIPGGGIFDIGEEEVLIDAGAFDGDTIERFLNLTGGKYRYIYAFEPDAENFKNLRKRNLPDNIKTYNAGLYDETCKLCFSANKGGSSKVESTGENVIQVYRFDELDIPCREVTFVKMDIEGSELKALQGMEQTIIKYKPKLAICIYHKFEDLWELPLYIKKLVPEYRLYIRNYTTYLDEIVLYAAI